jgi:L-threonylcarbamoyladenylate synthase
MSGSMPVTEPRGAINTRVHKSTNGELSQAALHDCLRALAGGGLIVVPTDTVYGIACSAFNPTAIARVYELKGRSYDKPLPIFIPDASQLSLVAADIPTEAFRLVGGFWPGALTLVLKTAPLAAAAAHGRSTIAIRVPDHGVTRTLLDHAGVPIAATSANQSGEPSINNGEDAVAQFKGRVDVIVDGGASLIGRESTVVDASRFPFMVLREGAIPKKELERCLRVA